MFVKISLFINNISSDLKSSTKEVYSKFKEHETFHKKHQYKKISKSEYKKRYDEAYTRYLDGDYNRALTMFNSLLDLENINDLSDNCQYWVGEIHYARRDFRSSIEAFNKISLINPKFNELLLRNLGLILFERLKQSNSKIVALSAN